MKIRTERAALNDVLQWVARAIPTTPNTPILSGIHITARDGVLTLAGFNHETSHTSTIPADIDGDGQAIVSGHYLRSIVASLRAGDVVLAAEGRELAITSGRASYRTPTMNLDDYPTLPSMPEADGTVDAGQFATAVAAVRPAVDDSPASASLAALAGIRLETSGQGLDLGATNRFMLVQATVDWAGSDLAATVPGKALEAAVKGMAGTLTLGLDGNVFGVSDGTRTVTTRLIAAEFPPRWRALIRPASDDVFAFTADGGDLHAAVSRAGKLTDGSVFVNVAADELEVGIVASERSSGTGSDFVQVESSGTESLSFSPAYLAGGLVAMPSGPVVVGVGTPNSPFIIRPAGNDDRVAVVMPIKKR